METESLASDLLRVVKAQSRCWFISFLMTLTVLVISNVLWILLK